MSFKAGFVALIGKPNTGKSTLLNSLLSRKVAITTPKPQTTRDNIRGILTLDDAQIIFVDTPGIDKSQGKLNTAMVKRAYDAIDDVDILLLLVDVSKPWNKGDDIIMESIRDINKPIRLPRRILSNIWKRSIRIPLTRSFRCPLLRARTSMNWSVPLRSICRKTCSTILMT